MGPAIQKLKNFKIKIDLFYIKRWKFQISVIQIRQKYCKTSKPKGKQIPFLNRLFFTNESFLGPKKCGKDYVLKKDKYMHGLLLRINYTKKNEIYIK